MCKKLSQQKQHRQYTMRPLLAAARMCEKLNRTLSVSLATRVLLNDMIYAYSVQQNLIIAIEGVGGSGKSEIAQSIAKMWTNMTGGKTHIIFDVDEVPQAKHGDFIILDEWIIPEGAGSQIAVNRLWNMISTVRAAMVSFAICAPSLPNVRFCHYFLETYSQDWVNRKNLVTVRVPLRGRLVEIGRAEIALHNDEKFREEYEKRKLERVEKILAKKGKKTIQFTDIAQVTEIALQEAQERQLVPRTQSQAEAVLSLLSEEFGWDLHYQSKREIASLMMLKLKQSQESFIEKQAEAHIEITGKGWEVFRLQLHELVSKLGVSEQYAEAISYYFVPIRPFPRYKDICTQLGLLVLPETLGYQVRKAKTRIKTKELGDIGEISLASWLDSLSESEHDKTTRVKRDSGVGGVDVWLGDIAINVKTTLEDTYREYVPTTPEFDYRPRAVLALLLPRALEIRLFKITEPKQTINRLNGVLASPSDVREKIRNLLC